jgi:hypothetical protein
MGGGSGLDFCIRDSGTRAGLGHPSRPEKHLADPALGPTVQVRTTDLGSSGDSVFISGAPLGIGRTPVEASLSPGGQIGSFQGLKCATPAVANSLVFRVATVSPCWAAVAAMRISGWL